MLSSFCEVQIKHKNDTEIICNFNSFLDSILCLCSIQFKPKNYSAKNWCCQQSNCITHRYIKWSIFDSFYCYQCRIRRDNVLYDTKNRWTFKLSFGFFDMRAGSTIVYGWESSLMQWRQRPYSNILRCWTDKSSWSKLCEISIHDVHAVLSSHKNSISRKNVRVHHSRTADVRRHPVASTNEEIFTKNVTILRKKMLHHRVAT